MKGVRMLRFCLPALLTAGAACLFSSSARAVQKPHPHIHHALYELREARAELRSAAHDFGGHRKAALLAINTAIGQLEKALKYSGDKRPFKGDPKADYYKKYRTYPHIRHAIHELRETVAELKAASHNYGGHRKKALEESRAAIKQLQLCIKFANSKK
jgi:hypothetical protein